MATRISRRKLSEYAAERLVKGEKPSVIIKEVAAFLIDTRRTREAELVVRDIESALAQRGIIVADVTSAFPLTDALKTEIKRLVGGKELVLRETVDQTVLGGIRLTTPGQRLDATLKRKIQALKA
jgi:F-type H+-transporting ATPase subunit delta